MSNPPAAFFARYTSLVTETDLLAAMTTQRAKLVDLFRSISSSQAAIAHPPYTWTLKQVVSHIIDAERVFGYRAMRFARGDATPLPGFDENAFAAAANSDAREMTDLVEEFNAIRQAHERMFAALPPDAWSRRGIASNLEWTVTDLAKAIIGHARHHESIVRKRLDSVRS